MHEVIDMYKETATATLLEFYEDAGSNKDIERYLDVVKLLKVESEDKCTLTNNQFKL